MHHSLVGGGCVTFIISPLSLFVWITLRSLFCPFDIRAMGNLAKLKELEYMNTDLGKMLSDTRSMNEDLLRAKERLNREVEKMKTDFDHLECTLSTTRRERDQFHEQLKVTQTVLSRTKDHMRVTCESHVSHMKHCWDKSVLFGMVWQTGFCVVL